MANPQTSPGKGTILLTGANGSLGSKMASQIASTPELAAYHGLYAVRDAQNAPVLRSALAARQQQQQRDASPSHAHDIISLDLTDLSSVRAVAGDINARVTEGEIPPIRALVLNAGYLEFTAQTWTAGGFDVTFASNYLGHWLLTLLLLGSMDREEGRVVVVGSEAHDPYNPKGKGSFNEARFMEFMRDGSSEGVARGTWSSSAEDPSYNGGFRRYGASKFCQVMMM
jgi:NAD(P)-dependent dehydrogenase (short-subunit alcohol dehydrogenase family)